MEIKVLGSGCEDCDTLYANTLIAVGNLGLDANVEKVQDLVEIVKLGVMSVPSVLVDGKLVISGQVAKPAKIEAILKKL